MGGVVFKNGTTKVIDANIELPAAREVQDRRKARPFQ
jgi:hypothetical protein